MSNYILGQAFPTPIEHNALLVVVQEQTALRVLGYVVLEAPVTFTGTETTHSYLGADYPVTSYQQTQKEGDMPPNKPYMCIFYTHEESRYLPWLSLPGFTKNSDAQGYQRWSMPSRAPILVQSLGNTIRLLQDGPDVLPTQSPATPTPPPAGQDGAIQWQASTPLFSMTQCSFTDFNWITTFQASLTADALGRIQPQRLVVKKNPDNASLRASVVQSGAVIAGGGVQYDTVRIIMTSDNVEEGDYTFEFEIFVTTDTGKLLSSTVELTLSIT